MTERYRATLFGPDVRAAQNDMGTAHLWTRDLEARGAETDRLGENEAAFIAARDSFYIASNGNDGWPYLQHRGGPVGFLKVLDSGTLGFADYRGNRQYVSLGNVERDDRVSLFFMDYVRKARLKLLGHMRAVDLAGDEALRERLRDPDYPGRAERGFVIAVDAFEWNCPQHIAQRFTVEEMMPVLAPMQQRIDELEAQLAALAAG